MAEIRQKMGFDAEQAIATLSKLTGALDGASASLGKMQSAATGAKSLSKVTDGTKKASKAANEFLVSWKTIIRVLETQLIVRGLNTIITGLKDAVENARELGLAIEEVRTIDAAGRTAADISEQVLRLSDAIGQAPTDLAEGLYQTLSNQVVEAADSFQFMSEAAKLAKVTASETGDAVNALSSVMNSYNKSAQEAEHVAGTLFATVEQGRLRLSEIANVIGRVTPLTSQLAISWEETAAAIATMTRQGVRADTAITQLRAVVTRLLKPTAEMSAIFHKWGVEDGRQAIQTFGGLTGVLKKLASETGHNSGEMAELLRNVRAIAGVFGIMSNEGKTIEEVLRQIEGASKDATEAWTEFAESDAQKLTVEMQKFDNMLTRLGTLSLPAVIKVLSGLTTGLQGFGVGIQIITGQWGEAEQAAVDYERAVREGAKDAIENQKAWAEASRGAYDVLTEASRTYYAEANKLEQQLATARDNSIASATAAFETVADSLTDLYSDSLKDIEKFADAAAGNVVKAFERIADLERSIEDQRLDYRLKQQKGYYDKLAVLDKAHQAAVQKRQIAALKITADSASEKKFRKASEREIELAKMRLDLAEKEKIGGQERLGLFLDVEKAQKAQIDGQKDFANASGIVADSAEELKGHFSDIEVRIKEILKRTKEIHEDGIIDPGEEAELRSLGAEYDKLEAKFKEGASVLADAGLDLDFNEVVDGLSAALDQAHKDWGAEVERAKAAFAKAVIPIQVALDPSGAREVFQKEIGAQQLPGEKAAVFAGRLDEAAKKRLDDDAVAQGAINKLRDEGAKPLKASLTLVDQISKKTNETATALATRYTAGHATALTAGQALLDVAKQGRAEADLQTVQASALEQAYRNQLTIAQQGGTIQQEAVTHLQQQVDKALENKQITQEQGKLYKQLNKQLGEHATRTQQIQELEKARTPEAELDAARDLLEQQKAVEQSTMNEAQFRKEIIDTSTIYQEMLNGMKKTTEGTANAAEKTANATGNASTQAHNYTSNVSASIEVLGNATTKAKALADQMERAARAAVSISSMSLPSGGGDSEYYGGPHYAAGGMFRGQDRQLTALARGETVVNRKQSRQFFSELNAMNQGSQPVYREQGGTVTNVGDVNVTVKGGDSSQQTVREIGHALRREVKRGNLRFR